MPQALHRHTPTLTAYDPRGLTIREVAYHRRDASEPPQPRINRQVFGATGFLTEQWDARLAALRDQDPTTTANQRSRYSLSGRVLHTENVDRGVRVALMGAGAELLHSWDARGTRQHCEYDRLLRLTGVYEQAAGAASPRCVERLTYAGNRAEDAALNRCARLIRHDDPAGTLWFEDYDVLGRNTGQSRRFVRDIDQAPDWPQPIAQRDQVLDTVAWGTRWRHDALGQLLDQTDARGNRQHSRYAVDGLLASLGVHLVSGRQRPVVQHRTYTASGRIALERAGNEVETVLVYQPEDDRLQQLRTYRADNPQPLQELTYTYDRVGNVLSIHDTAQPVQWSDNTRLAALSTYGYDSLYQLIEATGRENASHLPGPALPGVVMFGSASAPKCRNYRQSYRYDAGGNLTWLQHLPSQGSGYTRNMSVGARSNHGLSVVPRIPESPGLGRGFDANGNQQALAPGQPLGWNLRNQLQRVTRIEREDAANDEELYRYDGAGARVLKIDRSYTGRQLHRREVRYLPGLEIRDDSASGEVLNLLTVDTGLNSVRIVQWQQGRPAEIDNEQMRFSLGDHLGSSTLELDQQARLLSQESYYPYGGTAWWAARNTLEARYKFVRYSGTERDASGLYCFGLRYYAPWLARWINADPGDDIDGLNLYAMARGNPVSRVDAQGLLSTQVTAPSERVSVLRIITSGLTRLVRSRLQASSAAAIRDALASFISTAIGTGLDLALFQGRQPTQVHNQVLRSVVAALDAVAVMHMTTGLGAHLTRMSPLLGLAGATAAASGFEGQGGSEGVGMAEGWDPVARLRLVGHVRAFSREIVQQAIRGLGDSVSWGQTAVRARIPRTLMAAGAYALATVPNAVFGQYVPGPLMPNLAPAIEAYDAAAGTAIRAGHASAQFDRHVNALQVPEGMATLHGGVSRMFNQTWVYWAGVGIEAIAGAITGAPIAGQSARARAWVGAAKGVVSALTEVRGLLLQTARSGYGNLSRLWRTGKS